MQEEKTSLFVIAIGASAGGLKALQEFFENFSKVKGVAIIVNQHLPKNAASHLTSILSKSADFNVVEAKSGEMLREGFLYVVPGWAQLTLEKGKIVLNERVAVINETINTLFTSVGEEFGPKSMGIIFSGTGSDGLQGVKAIEANNGIVLVQDPGTAAFDGMPKTIITSDHPDHVLKPSQMPIYILAHLSTRHLTI